MTAAAGERKTARVPVAHRLFTNAPGGDGGTGFRHLRVGGLPDGARVDSWLESVRPATGGGLAWAGAAFRLGGALHLAVARVDGAFRPDEHGRGQGHLAHAIVAAAGEGEPDRDLPAELVEAVERLARPTGESGDLETLVAGCASLEGVECSLLDRWWRSAAAVASRSGAPGDAAWSETVVLGASGAESAGALEVLWPSAAAPATAAARAVAASLRALPPRLRLALRWSVAAQPLADDRLRIALAPSAAPPPPALAGPAAAYAEWLRERLAAGDGAAVAAVAGDWRIRSWRHLAERLGAVVAR